MFARTKHSSLLYQNGFFGPESFLRVGVQVFRPVSSFDPQVAQLKKPKRKIVGEENQFEIMFLFSFFFFGGGGDGRHVILFTYHCIKHTHLRI
jgi:hypothetical protein